MATRRFKFSRRRFSGGKARAKHWTAQLMVPTDLVVGNQLTTDLVTPADYASNTLLSPSGVTLVRLVGSIVGAPLPQQGNANSTLWAAIVAADEEDTTFVPNSAQSLIDDRVLWSGVIATGRKVAASADVLIHPATQWNAWRVEIDIKQRVRMQDTAIRLELVNEGGGNFTFQVAGMFRALLVGDTT